MASVHFQGKPFDITIIHVYAITTNAKEAEAHQFYENVQNFLELAQKDVLSIMGLECKRTESRDTQNNRQLCPRVQNEAGQRLTEFCQENTLVIANTLFQQHKRLLYM